MKNKTKDEIFYLLKLLDDPDESVFIEIKNTIIKKGSHFKPVLEEGQINLTNDLAKKRLEQIINEINLNETIYNLNDWKKNNPNDIMQGLLIIEKFFDNAIDPKNIKENINKILNELWLEVNDQLTAIEKIKLINQTIFKIHKFRYISKKNINTSIINFSKLINEKVFIDYTISLLYYIICEKLELSVKFLNINSLGYNVLGYIDDVLAKVVFNKKNNNIVFYISPTFNGEILSESQLISIASKKDIDIKTKEIQALSNAEVLNKWVKFKMEVFYSAKKNNFAIDNANQLLKVL